MLYMSTFGKKVTSAVLTSAVVLTAIGSAAGVQAAYTNLDAANKLANLGVVVDQSANPAAYRLADTVQRQEALKIMMKLSGQEVSQEACTSPFADIADSDWACKYAVAALNSGFIAANDNYRPADEVSKIEALKMVMKARGFEKDTTVADWKEGYVNAAVEKQIANAFSDYNASAERGVMFVWAAEAVAPTVEVVEDDIDLGELLGLGDDEEVEETPTEVVETEEVETTVEDETVVSGDDNLTVSLNPETPSDGLAPADTARVPLLVFDVAAGSEDVTLQEATLEFIGLGSYTDLDSVSIYNSKWVQVSKSKNFSEVTREISFDNDIVVEAGNTMTLTVVGTISPADSDTNVTYGVKLIDLKASSDVEGEDLIGALLVPADFSNVGELKLNIDEVSGTDITIGDEITLADFELDEKSDDEDVNVKTITFSLWGWMDYDDLSDLVLYIDWEEVVSDLVIDSDDEIVAYVDYTIAAKDNASFVLKGVVTGSVSDTLSANLKEVYAIGARSGVNIWLIGDAYGSVASARTIEGSEINVSFDKSDIDEAKPDAEEVNVWTLTLSTDGECNVDRLEVKVEYTGNSSSVTGVSGAIDDMDLDGRSYDNVSSTALTTKSAVPVDPVNTDTTLYYYFEDISLNNESFSLPLTFDLVDDSDLNTSNLEFTVKLVSVEDEDNNETYDLATANINDILSTNSLKTNDIDVKTANITFTSTSVNDRLLVLWNGIEAVAYKGKISVGDADAVSVNDFNFTTTSNTSLSNSADLTDIIDTATLNVGGKTFDWDIKTTGIDFNTNLEIEAGSKSVEVMMTVILKDNDGIANWDTLELEVKTADLADDVEDSDNNEIDTANLNDDSINDNLASVELLDKGELSITLKDDVDTDDNLENAVLAGSDDVTLAELELEAEYEDVKVKELSFTIVGDASSTLKNVRLVSGSTTIATADEPIYDGSTNTVITFDDDFVISEEDNVMDVEWVADLYSITTVG